MGQLSCSNEDNNAVKILEFEEHSSNDSDLDRVRTSCIDYFLRVLKNDTGRNDVASH